VHTYSGYENKVAQNIQKVVDNRKLHDYILEVRIPTEMVTEVTDKNKVREVEKKIFPGYVLVKMLLNDDSWYVVRNTRGVTGFVGPASKPVALTEKEVEALGVEREKTVEVNFKLGDEVRISTGAMEGFVGIVREINTEEMTVSVAVSLFGRETVAAMPIFQVSKTGGY